MFSPRWPASFLGTFCLALVVLLSVLASPCQAAEAEATLAAPPLLANWLMDQMGNRTRMIQVGIVVVAIGVFLLTRAINK